MKSPINAINARASVRRYKGSSVERELLETLVDAGRRAPTARAIEPWEFIVVTAEDKLTKLGELADHGPFIRDAAACIVVYCADTKYYLEDGCAATENILLEASELGLGACWVAGDKKPYAPQVSDLLGVPEGMKLVSMIPVGWPEKKPVQAKKRTLKDVIHWENF